MERLLRLKDQAFDANVLGAAGESYVRKLLIKAGFRNVTQRKRLGAVRVGSSKSDISATYMDRGGRPVRLFIEVKNCRETFHAKGRQERGVINKLFEDALNASLQPFLVAVRLSDCARDLCRRLGIAYLELSRQVLPNRLRSLIAQLPRSVLGADEFYFINPQRPFRNGLPEYAKRHLAVLQDTAWLEDNREAWLHAVEASRPTDLRVLDMRGGSPAALGSAL